MRPKNPDPEAEANALQTGTYLDELPAEMRPMQGADKPEVAARVAEGTGEDVFRLFARTGAPFASSLVNMQRASDYTRAQGRIMTGEAADKDYATVAEYEALQKRDAKDQDSVAGTALHVGLGVFRVAGEMEMGGAILGGISPGVEPAKGLLPAAGRLLGKTAIAPSMYSDTWVQHNLEQGRAPADIRGLPAAYGMGLVQMAVLGSLGNVGEKIVPGKGAANFFLRQGVRGVVGLGEAQAGEAAAGVVQDAVKQVAPQWVPLETPYGPVGELVRGDGRGALKSATISAMTFAAFGALHEASHGRPMPAAEDPHMQAYIAKLQEMKSRGVAREEAGRRLLAPYDVLNELLKRNPEPDPIVVANAMKVLPTRESREWGMAIAETMARRNTIPRSPAETAQEAPGRPETPEATQRPVEPVQEAQPTEIASQIPIEDLKAVAKQLGLAGTGKAEDIEARIRKAGGAGILDLMRNPEPAPEPPAPEQPTSKLEQPVPPGATEPTEAPAVESRGVERVDTSGPPAADPATGIINPVETGVPGIRSGAVEIPEPPAKPSEPVKPAEVVETPAERAARRLENQRRKQKGLAPIEAPRVQGETINRARGDRPAEAKTPGVMDKPPPMKWDSLPDQAKQNFRDLLIRAGAQRMVAKLAQGEAKDVAAKQEAEARDKRPWQEKALDHQVEHVSLVAARNAKKPTQEGSAGVEAAVRKLQRMVRGRGLPEETIFEKLPHLRDLVEEMKHKDAGKGLRESGRQWIDRAKAEGLDPGHVRYLADEIIEMDRIGVEEKTDFIREVRDQLGKQGKLLHLERYEDPGDVPGLDEVAQYWANRRPGMFGNQNPDQVIFDLLKGGNPERLSQEEAYRQAYENVAEMKRVATPTDEDVNGINQELREAGEQPLTPEDLAEAQRAAVGEGSGAEAGDDSFDFGQNAPGAPPGAGEAKPELSKGMKRADQAVSEAKQSLQEMKQELQDLLDTFRQIEAKKAALQKPADPVESMREAVAQTEGTRPDRFLTELKRMYDATVVDGPERTTYQQVEQMKDDLKGLSAKEVAEIAKGFGLHGTRSKQGWIDRISERIEGRLGRQEKNDVITKRLTPVPESDQPKEAPKPAKDFHAEPLAEMFDAMIAEQAGTHPSARQITIGDLRERVRDKFGNEAAGKPFDEAMQKLAQERRIRMSASDGFELGPDGKPLPDEERTARKESGIPDEVNGAPLVYATPAWDIQAQDTLPASRGKPAEPAKSKGKWDATRNATNLREMEATILDGLDSPDVTPETYYARREAVQTERARLEALGQPKLKRLAQAMEIEPGQDAYETSERLVQPMLDQIDNRLSRDRLLGREHTVEATKSPASILGVQENASLEEIRTAFRNQSKKYHPDKNPGSAIAAEKFRIIKTAYETLADQARRGASVAPAQEPKADPFEQAAQQLAKDEAGSADPEVIVGVARSIAGHLGTAYNYLRQSFQELAGQMAPRTRELSEESNNKLAQFMAGPTYAKELTPVMIDKVLGPETTPEQARLWGTAFQEMRHRHAIKALQEESFRLQDAAEKTRQRAMESTKPAEAEALRNLAKEYDARAKAQAKASQDIRTFIGQDGSPLASEFDFQRVTGSEEFQAMLERYKQHMVPEMEKNFRAAEGLEEDDPIDNLTQMEGLPMNAKAIRPGETPGEGAVFFGGGRGNLKNVKIGRLGFAERATLAAEGYDTDLRNIIENSIARGVTAARKAEMYRQAATDKVGVWAPPGKSPEGYKEIPGTRPPRGTQEAGPSDVFHVRTEAYDEFRKALAVDAPFKAPMIRAFNYLVARGALVSTAEATYHAKNLLTMMAKPGMSPVDLVQNAYKVVTGDPVSRDALVELARIGAMKEKGLESGNLWGGRTDPTYWMGKMLDVMDRTMRLTADQAFTRLAKQGLAEGSESNRRDFINQLGQYNKRAQNGLVVWLRDTGFGPFATAGSNFYAQGWRTMFMDPGIRATSPEAAIRLRAAYLARMAAIPAMTALLNYLAWGRVDGDEATPFGAIKIGADPKTGRTAYFDATNLTGLTRGMRQAGILAQVEGFRKGAKSTEAGDKGIEQATAAIAHPAMGPSVQFAWTAATGKNLHGIKIAEKADKDELQHWEDLKAAFLNVNPSLAVTQGFDRPSQEAPADERYWKLLGPFGVQHRYKPGYHPPPALKRR